jgi:phosphoribosylformylglycinamidine cyclo-ligase
VTSGHKSAKKAAKMDYKKSGVDIEAGDALVGWLQSAPKKKSKVPHANRIVSGIGGFASLFRISFPHMKKPCLVSSTDGVGTKVKLAAEFKSYRSVGQDLVAMCVNDLACVGAQPLFFLDYYATGKLDLQAAKEFLSGVREACHESDCALIGGETAEMPGVYHEKDFDCAGFVVGVVDENATLGSHLVKKDDILIGIRSSGFHSNGYSLLRKVFAKDLKKWAPTLLKPTHLYVKLVLELRKKLKSKLHAVAHVTGGGFDNILRVIPEKWGVDILPFIPPQEFREVQKRTEMPWSEMLNTLNCGVGLVLVVPRSELKVCLKTIQENDFDAFELGQVNSRTPGKWDVDWNKWQKKLESISE